MSHGLKILVLLRGEMQRLGRKPSDIESASVIDTYLVASGLKLKRAKKAGTPRLRARDEIFDLLAKLDGVADTKQLTRHGAAKIAEAKKQILEVMPERSIDEVLAEINARWTRWCRKHADAKIQTVMALVAHWAELGGGPKTQAGLADIYQEPEGDWRTVMSDVCKIDPLALVDNNWLDIGVDYRRATLTDMAKNGRVGA